VSKLYSIHCVPTTRPLHSLPTRRSSDLDPRPDGGADLDELHRDLDPQQVHQGVVTVTKPPTANLRYAQRTQPATSSSPAPAVMATRGLNVHYGNFQAVADVDLDFRRNEVTALIGPSGCGKSTVLRCLNRMNDLVASARVSGSVTYHGQDVYAPEVDPIEVRR